MRKLSPATTVIVSLLLLSLVSFLLQALFPLTEMFYGSTSPGTMVQLQTSHVPTEEDVRGLGKLTRQIQKDLVDMTGSA